MKNANIGASTAADLTPLLWLTRASLAGIMKKVKLLSYIADVSSREFAVCLRLHKPAHGVWSRERVKPVSASRRRSAGRSARHADDVDAVGARAADHHQRAFARPHASRVRPTCVEHRGVRPQSLCNNAPVEGEPQARWLSPSRPT